VPRYLNVAEQFCDGLRPPIAQVRNDCAVRHANRPPRSGFLETLWADKIVPPGYCTPIQSTTIRWRRDLISGADERKASCWRLRTRDRHSPAQRATVFERLVQLDR